MRHVVVQGFRDLSVDCLRRTTTKSIIDKEGSTADVRETRETLSRIPRELRDLTRMRDRGQISLEIIGHHVVSELQLPIARVIAGARYWIRQKGVCKRSPDTHSISPSVI